MSGRDDIETCENNRRQLQGLPVIRRNVAGIDLGSERQWVCASTLDGRGREIDHFVATTPELIRLGEWLKEKTDATDCEWIQWLHSCGLLRGSFRPEEAICLLRTLVRDKANLVRS